MGDVLILGCGLIGTSVGLALRAASDHDVMLSDADSAHTRTAVAKGAGRAWNGDERADLVVVAAPPHATGRLLLELQSRSVGSTYTHVSSVQSHVQAEIEGSSSDPSRVVGGHPLAGREVSGPSAALASLFSGRPWAVCPGPAAAPDAVDAVHNLAQLCGAVPLRVTPGEHDRAVAISSHLPQVVSTALAGLLVEGADLRLAGPGLADMTRLAGSQPSLWTEILVANAAQVLGPLGALSERLAAVADALARAADDPGDGRARSALLELLLTGNSGRELVPLKRGASSEAFADVRVAVTDEPGRLAGLLTCAGELGVNVEDIRVDHLPGTPHGVIELVVRREAADALRSGLVAAGWDVLAG